MEPIPCAQCGVIFKRRRSSQTVCPSCKQKHAEQQYAETVISSKEERICPICNRSFTPDIHFRTCCCLWCKAQYDKAKRKEQYRRKKASLSGRYPASSAAPSSLLMRRPYTAQPSVDGL